MSWRWCYCDFLVWKLYWQYFLLFTRYCAGAVQTGSLHNNCGFFSFVENYRPNSQTDYIYASLLDNSNVGTSLSLRFCPIRKSHFIRSEEFESTVRHIVFCSIFQFWFCFFKLLIVLFSLRFFFLLLVRAITSHHIMDIRHVQYYEFDTGFNVSAMEGYSKFVAEVLGTAFLMFGGCMGCLTWDTEPPPYMGGVSFGLTVMILIQCYGHISGAHFNPAVTVAAIVFRSISIPVCISNWWILPIFLGNYTSLFGFFLKIISMKFFYLLVPDGRSIFLRTIDWCIAWLSMFASINTV